MKKQNLALAAIVVFGVCVLLTWHYIRKSDSDNAPTLSRHTLATGVPGSKMPLPEPKRQQALLSSVSDKIPPGTNAAPPTLVRATWGTGLNQLGRSQPNEANPEAPSSLTVDTLGRTVVLDNVNERIVRYDQSGQVIDTFPVPLHAPQEIVAAPDGSLLVMDRLVDEKIAILDEQGRVQGELPLVGEGLEQGGSATGLFSDAEGIYVENEHSQVYRVGDLAGRVDNERQKLDGRPSKDGKSLVSVRLLDREGGKFMVRVVDRSTDELRLQKQVVMTKPLIDLVFLDTDLEGRIYAGAHVGREIEPGKLSGEAIHVVCLGSTGAVEGTAVLPANTGGEETFRDLSLLGDGVLVYMERSEQGVVVREYHCS
jgi:hypothetical protein